MAGPINGIGGQQQIPISQTFQPGKESEATRQSGDSQPQENKVQQSRSSAPAETQNSQGSSDQSISSHIKRLTGGDSDQQSARRGSLVDITV